MLFTALVLSVAALALGPIAVLLGRGRTRSAAALDGVTLGLIPAIVLVRLLPHVARELGAVGIGTFAMGYLALWLADRVGHRRGAQIGQVVVVPALALHAFTDGAALAAAVAAHRAGQAGGALLAGALLVHRVPEGLFLATTLVPAVGWRGALVRIGAVAAATLFGGFMGGALLAHVPGAVFELAIALALGAMLRLIVHTHGPTPATTGARVANVCGFLAGIVAALAIRTTDDVLVDAAAGEVSVARAIVPLFAGVAPAVLAGWALSAASAWALDRFGARTGGVAAWLAPSIRTPVTLVGAVVAGQLTLETLPYAFRLLGVPLGALVAVGGIATAALVGNFARARSEPGGESAFLESPARIGAALLVGVSVAACVEAAVPRAAFTSIDGPWAAAMLALVASPAVLGTYVAVPLVAVIVHKGLSIAAAVALFAVARTLDPRMLARAHRVGSRRAVVVVIIAGAAIALVLAVAAAQLPGRAVPGIHALLLHAPNSLEWAAAAIVFATLLASLLRTGVRAWVNRAFATGEDAHTHDHHHPHEREASAPSPAERA